VQKNVDGGVEELSAFERDAAPLVAASRNEMVCSTLLR
jgi:hypothetical protein